MKYRNLTIEEKYIVSSIETLSKMDSISDNQKAFLSPERLRNCEAYVVEDKNFHYNTYQADFRPDRGTCPDNSTLKIWQGKLKEGVAKVKNLLI